MYGNSKPTILLDVRDSDMPIICDIYADEVISGVSSWEDQPPSLEEMIQRRDGIVANGYPYRVAELNGWPD